MGGGKTKKVVFFNTKGGTGKTTICYNYGWYLAKKKDKKVLFLDFDPQTNLVQAFNKGSSNEKSNNFDKLIKNYINGRDTNFKDYIIKINNNIDLLPSSNNIALIEEYLTDYLLKKSFKEQKMYKAIYRNTILYELLKENINEDDYDYIVIDAQPNFSLLSATSLIYAKNIILVLKPELFSFLDIDYLSKIIKNLEKGFHIKIGIAGIIINAFEKRKKISEYIVKNIENRYKDKLTIFKQNIRYLVPYQKSILLKREPVFISYPNEEASNDIIKLFSMVDECLNNLN